MFLLSSRLNEIRYRPWSIEKCFACHCSPNRGVKQDARHTVNPSEVDGDRRKASPMRRPVLTCDLQNRAPGDGTAFRIVAFWKVAMADGLSRQVFSYFVTN